MTPRSSPRSGWRCAMRRDLVLLLALWGCGDDELVIRLSTEKGREIKLEGPPSSVADATYEWVIDAPFAEVPIDSAAAFIYFEPPGAGITEVVRRTRRGDVLFEGVRFIIDATNSPPAVGELDMPLALVDIDVPLTIDTSDPNADVLSITWELTGQPDGSIATLTGRPSSPETRTFHTDTVGRHEVTITVDDGDGGADTAVFELDAVGPMTEDVVVGGFGDPLGGRPALSSTRRELVVGGPVLHIFDLETGDVEVDDGIRAEEILAITPSGRYVWIREQLSDVTLYDLATRAEVYSTQQDVQWPSATNQALYWRDSSSGSQVHALFWQTDQHLVSETFEGTLGPPVLSPAIGRVFVPLEPPLDQPHEYRQLSLMGAPTLEESGMTPFRWGFDAADPAEVGWPRGALEGGDRVICDGGQVLQLSTQSPPEIIARIEPFASRESPKDLAHNAGVGVVALAVSNALLFYDDSDFELIRNYDTSAWEHPPEQSPYVHAYEDGFLLVQFDSSTVKTLFIPAPSP